MTYVVYYEGFDAFEPYDTAGTTRTILLAVFLTLGVLAFIWWTIRQRRQEKDELQTRHLRDIGLGTVPQSASAIERDIETARAHMTARKEQATQRQTKITW